MDKDVTTILSGDDCSGQGWNVDRKRGGGGFRLCGATLSRLFERQVERTPRAPAVTFEGIALSYAELNEQSNRVARHLQHLGVGRESLVGLAVNRSLHTVIGILGILKAGGAYVPLDPSYPDERFAFTVADTEMKVVVTHRDVETSLPYFAGSVVSLDGDAEAIAGERGDNLAASPAADDLAYIIYTSGSTGTPKGVMVTHHNVVRLMQSTEPWFGFNGKDVWTLFHSYAFDFSVWELWGALLYGGRLVVVPGRTSRTPDEFYRLLVDQQVTVLNQTPSAFRLLMAVDAEQQKREALSLRLIIFGGEALDIPGLAPWFDRRGDTHPRLVNMYGITETTVHVTYRPIGRADLAKGAPKSAIGEPIPDLSLLVLDEQLQAVRPGAVGELYVGGAGLARGYLNRPELTEQRFIADPSGPPGSRLYRTGDLARVLPNGDLDYVGRIDHQVKVRGHRIELGEVESVLRLHPVVENCVVLVDDDQITGQHLLAFVEAASGGGGIGELREFLEMRLPPYMMPADIVPVRRFPLNANGKIDRDALRAMRTDPIRAETAGEVSLTNSQEMIALAWKTVLQVDTVGLDQNFFDLGGDSMRLGMVAAALRGRLPLPFTIMDLLRHPTIRAFSESLQPGPSQDGALRDARDRAARGRGAIDAMRAARGSKQ